MADLESEEEDAAACFYMDEDFESYGDPNTWRPSDLFRIGGLILATGKSRDAATKAQRWRAAVIERARERWRAGFYANPFTPEPIERHRNG
jgi:hypothetical protein